MEIALPAQEDEISTELSQVFKNHARSDAMKVNQA